MTLQTVASLIDDAKVVIYDHNVFIIQVTGKIFVSKARAYPKWNTFQAFPLLSNIRLKRVARGKCSSLFDIIVADEEKKVL